MNKAKRSSTSSHSFSDDISLVGVQALANGRYSMSEEYSSYCIVLFISDQIQYYPSICERHNSCKSN